jgi:protein SCO1
MISRSNLSRLAAAALLGASLSSLPAFAHVPIPPRDPSEVGRRVVKTAVDDFTLVDQESKPFHFNSTRGKVVLVTFIFTTCTDVCPLLTAKFAAIQRALAEKKTGGYLLLSITTDPERDSARVLREYAGRFKADFRNWAFLTGSRQEMAKAWKIFAVNVTRTEAGDVNHTSLTTLIDRRGERRVNYYGEKWHEKDVLKDLQKLLAQKP